MSEGEAAPAAASEQGSRNLVMRVVAALVLAPLAIGLAVFVIIGALCDLAERIALFRIPFSLTLRRARGLPRATWGTAFAHAGLGVALIGIVCETTWNSEYIATMKPNDVARVAGYDLKLDGLLERMGYRES